ncbi:DUF4846 domain-containing protein [Candidatus Poribacteria bacterium]
MFHVRILSSVFFLIVASLIHTGSVHPCSYPWQDKHEESEAIANRISFPEGYERIETVDGTFENWLRHLPLKKGTPAVYLYNDRAKPNQDAHFAVVDIDAGSKNLQQCADAIIRLRAEYLYSLQSYEKIYFNFTSGDRAGFKEWVDGYTAIVKGNKVTWVREKARDSSHRSLRRYLNVVFMYAGSYSLSRELQGVQDVNEMQIGDVFIEGGFPGHAVIVVDMAVDEETGKRLFLLAQSYMPAQDIHILKNPADSSLSPWYELDFGKVLYTPEWAFDKDDLRRF